MDLPDELATGKKFEDPFDCGLLLRKIASDLSETVGCFEDLPSIVEQTKLPNENKSRASFLRHRNVL